MTEKKSNILPGYVRFVVDIPVQTKKKLKMYATFTGKTVMQVSYEAFEEYIEKMSQQNRHELSKIKK